MYDPAALQFPAEAHDTEPRLISAPASAPAGRGACIPAAQLPPDSISKSPRWYNELSK
jgi:hypothetical protein